MSIGSLIAVLVGLLLLVLGKVCLDLASKQAQGWLFELCFAVLRVARRRLPAALRTIRHDEEFVPELQYILFDRYANQPIVGLFKGFRYAFGHVRSARQLARESGVERRRKVLEYRLPVWLRWWGGALVAAACAGAAFVVQVQAGEHLSTWTSLSIKIGGTAATVIALLLPARQTWIEVREREDAQQLATAAEANYQLALYVLLPLADIFHQIVVASSETDQIEARRAAKQAVVDYVVHRADIQGSRACFFDYENSGQERRLVCSTYAGRGRKPRAEFSSIDPHNTEIFALLDARQSELKESAPLEASRRFSPDKDYKTYISVPVATEKEIFGLLTLDSLRAGELLPQHEEEMLLLARLLGIALAGGKKDTP